MYPGVVQDAGLSLISCLAWWWLTFLHCSVAVQDPRTVGVYIPSLNRFLPRMVLYSCSLACFPDRYYWVVSCHSAPQVRPWLNSKDPHWVVTSCIWDLGAQLDKKYYFFSMFVFNRISSLFLLLQALELELWVGEQEQRGCAVVKRKWHGSGACCQWGCELVCSGSGPACVPHPHKGPPEVKIVHLGALYMEFLLDA